MGKASSVHTHCAHGWMCTQQCQHWSPILIILAESMQDSSSYCPVTPFTEEKSPYFPGQLKHSQHWWQGRGVSRRVGTWRLRSTKSPPWCCPGAVAATAAVPEQPRCHQPGPQRMASSQGEKHVGEHNDKTLSRQAKKQEKHTLALLWWFQKGPQDRGAEPERGGLQTGPGAHLWPLCPRAV